VVGTTDSKKDYKTSYRDHLIGRHTHDSGVLADVFDELWDTYDKGHKRIINRAYNGIMV
jgi:hypothetical protein